MTQSGFSERSASFSHDLNKVSNDFDQQNDRRTDPRSDPANIPDFLNRHGIIAVEPLGSGSFEALAVAIGSVLVTTGRSERGGEGHVLSRKDRDKAVEAIDNLLSVAAAAREVLSRDY